MEIDRVDSGLKVGVPARPRYIVVIQKNRVIVITWL